MGNVDSCKIEHYPDGTSRGYGYVHFEKEEDAAKAIVELNDTELCGKKIVVVEHKRRDQREPAEIQFNNLFAKGIPPQYSSQKFSEIFAAFGEILSVKLPRETENDENTPNKGFGYVCFKTAESAKEALNKLDGKEVEEGHVLQVSRHVSKRERELQNSENYQKEKQMRNSKYQESNLHVKPLPADLTDEKLKDVFMKFGEIVSAKIQRKNTTNEKGEVVQVSREFGFVCFADSECARKAFIELNGAFMWGKKLEIEYFEPKEERMEKFHKEKI